MSKPGADEDLSATADSKIDRLHSRFPQVSKLCLHIYGDMLSEEMLVIPPTIVLLCRIVNIFASLG